MKYNLFLYFRLAICTLIVPSTLFASNADQSQTLEQHIDKLCNALTEEQLQLDWICDSKNNKYRGKVRNQTFIDISPLLSIFITSLTVESGQTCTLDTLKKLIKHKLLSDDLNTFSLVNFSLLLNEPYVNNMKPLEFLNIISDEESKSWDDLKTQYISLLTDKNFKNEDFKKNNTTLFTTIEKAGIKNTDTLRNKIINYLEQYSLKDSQLSFNELFKETFFKKNKTTMAQFRSFFFISEHIVSKKDFSLEKLVNKILKACQDGNTPPTPINEERKSNENQNNRSRINGNTPPTLINEERKSNGNQNNRSRINGDTPPTLINEERKSNGNSDSPVRNSGWKTAGISFVLLISFVALCKNSSKKNKTSKRG